MFPVTASLPNLPGVSYPDVCTEQPVGNSAFCAYHQTQAISREYPTDVKGFLSFCGTSSKAHIEGYIGG